MSRFFCEKKVYFYLNHLNREWSYHKSINRQYEKLGIYRHSGIRNNGFL